MNFTCPNCDGHRIEEIMVDVTMSTEVNDISEYGDVNYGDQCSEGGVIDRFQCMECGERIGDHVTDTESLYDYITAIK